MPLSWNLLHVSIHLPILYAYLCSLLLQLKSNVPYNHSARVTIVNSRPLCNTVEPRYKEVGYNNPFITR